MTGTVLVYDPTAPLRQQRPAQSGPALSQLTGISVGFIDNSKPNFNHLVDDLADLLVTRYGVKAIVRHRKPMAGIATPDQVMRQLTEQCDLVITGSGD